MKRLSNSYTALLSGLTSLVVFLWLHPQILTYGDTRFIGGAFGDGGLYVWLTKLFIADPWQALHFETNAFYPYPISRAWSDSFILPSFVASILVSLGAHVMSAYNVVLLSALACNAFSSSLFASTLGLRPIGAFAVGIMIANSAYLVGNLGHPQLLFFFWIPLAWSAVLGTHGTLRAASRRWMYAGLCVAGAFYSAVYYAIFASLGLSIIWLTRFFSGQMSQRRAFRTLMLATLGASPIIYALRYYLAVQSYFGERGVYEATAFAASGLSYLAFPPLNDLFGATSSLSHSEAFLCPGYIALGVSIITATLSAWKRSPRTLVLLLVSLTALCISSSAVDSSMTSEYVVCVSAWFVLALSAWLARSAPTPLGLLIAISALFFVLSFGPGGDPTKHEPTFAPFGVLYSLVPGLGSIRAVSRFGSIVALGLIISAVHGCIMWAASRPRLATLLIALLTGITVAENSVSTIPLDTIPAAPRAFELLSRKNIGNEAALALPFGGTIDGRSVNGWSEIAILSSQYAQWATDSRVTVVNGYSGQRTKLQYELARVTASFPTAEAFEYFGRVCGLRWIVVTPTLSASWSEQAFMQRLLELSAYTAEVTTLDDKSILIKLADTTIPIPSQSDSNSLVLFAPTHTPTRITIPPVQTQGSEACTITAETLNKAGTGPQVTFQVSEAGFTGVMPFQPQSERPHTSYTSQERAIPSLVKLSATGCQPRISCGL